jgi:hypothetical protein
MMRPFLPPSLFFASLRWLRAVDKLWADDTQAADALARHLAPKNLILSHMPRVRTTLFPPAIHHNERATHFCSDQFADDACFNAFSLSASVEFFSESYSDAH